jgi:hypothetical protein
MFGSKRDLIDQEHVPKKETEAFLKKTFSPFPIVHVHVPKAHFFKSDGKTGGLGYAFITLDASIDPNQVVALAPWKNVTKENVDAILRESAESSIRVLTMYVALKFHLVAYPN